jgi:hypothetical protein
LLLGGGRSSHDDLPPTVLKPVGHRGKPLGKPPLGGELIGRCQNGIGARGIDTSPEEFANGALTIRWDDVQARGTGRGRRQPQPAEAGPLVLDGVERLADPRLSKNGVNSRQSEIVGPTRAKVFRSDTVASPAEEGQLRARGTAMEVDDGVEPAPANLSDDGEAGRQPASRLLVSTLQRQDLQVWIVHEEVFVEGLDEDRDLQVGTPRPERPQIGRVEYRLPKVA